MNEYAQIIIVVAGAIAGLSVIWHQLVRPLYRNIKRGEDVWKSVNTLEPFQAEVREFMTDMRTTKDLIEHHVTNLELHGPVQVHVTNDNTNQQ